MLLENIYNAISENVISAKGDMTTAISGASPDSRKICPGFLFCAMKGAKLDGHDYIPQAIANGASAILAEHQVDIPNDVPLIVVKNPYKVFGIVAEIVAKKPTDSFSILAVTGTNGKTTTAYLLREILKVSGHSTGMIGTVEYDLGNGTKINADRTTPTPFELQELFSALKDNTVEYAVMETSSHALEQGRLGTAKCQLAIFTNLTQDHLDYHLNMENYYQAKKLLFTQHLADDGTAIINCDDKSGCRLAKELASPKTLCYSFNGENSANVHIHDLSLTPGGSSFVISFPNGTEWNASTRLPGIYNAANAAGALCAAFAIGIEKESALAAIANSSGAPGRMQPVSISGQNFHVYVDYAHTDDALCNVLSAFKSIPHNRIITVFGCGGDRDRTKRPLMGKAAAENSDMLFVTSDNPRSENPEDIIGEIVNGIPYNTPYQTITDRREAIFAAISQAKPDDIVLIAGKGHEDYQEIKGVKNHFNDCETALEALKKRLG